jgi:hypothetical protein
MDMPRAMKVWNIYRSRLIGHYLQSQGICVIPTVSWAERETYTFCFDGIEPGGVVAISTIGCIKDEYARSIWNDGVDYMIDKLKPTAILIYGQSIEHDFKGIKVIYYKKQSRREGKKTWAVEEQVVVSVTVESLMGANTIQFIKVVILNL